MAYVSWDKQTLLNVLGKRSEVVKLRVVRLAADTQNERRSMVFMADSLYDGSCRILTIVDHIRRVNSAIKVDLSFTEKRVVDVLEQLAKTQGLPKVIVTDNRMECPSRALDQGAHCNGVIRRVDTRLFSFR